MNFDKTPITDCIGTFMADFTKQYTKGFAVALVKDSLDGDKKVSAPDRRLRKFEPSAPVLASEVQFSSDGGKKTKAVYWKINSKYNIDVYEKAKDAEGGKKPKNTICPWDYSAWYWYPPTEFPRRRGGPPWESGAEKPECPDCKEKFSVANRRKHCRTCGFVKCWNCTKKEWPLYTLGYTEPQGVCKGCFKKLEEEGLDSFKFPEEKKSETFGIRMYHGYRKPLYFTVPSSELQRSWLDALYSCCRYAEAPRNPSKFQSAAFEAAHRYVWWNQGPWWRWWKVFGSEEEMLSELLAWVVNRRCLSACLAGIKVPGAARAKAEKLVEGTIEKMVDAAVSASWPKAVEAIGKAEGVLVPKIKAQLDPIGAAKRAVVASLQEKIATPISQAIEKVGNPLLDKVLPLMFKPLVKSFVAAPMVLREAYKEFRESLGSDLSAKDWKHKCDRFYFWWRVRDKITEPELEPMIEVLNLLGKVPPFNYLNAYGIKYAIASAIEEILENAFYTVATEPDVLAQLEAKTDAKAVADAAWPVMYEKFCYDSTQIVRETCRSILMDMLAQPILKNVMEAPGVSDALEAAQGLIPEPLQEFFSIPGTVEEILGGALSTIVDKIVEDNMRSGMDMLVEGQKALKDQLK
jgi:hypothetical protein